MVCNWFILLLFIVCLGWSMDGPPFLFRMLNNIPRRIQTMCNWSTHELMVIEMFLWTAAGILWVSLKCICVCKFLVFLPRNGPAELQDNPVSVIEKLFSSLMRALPACNPTVMKKLWFFFCCFHQWWCRCASFFGCWQGVLIWVIKASPGLWVVECSIPSWWQFGEVYMV